MKKQKGISLIVLVITILVMIILAGVVIVSLQNDNPINKAKYAKMVDSLGSVRGAISQYAANAQAHDSVETDMKNLVNNYNPETGTGILKPGKEVKDKLGVDPTPLQKEGDIIVHVATGRTEYELNTDAYNDQIKEQKPEGIKPPKDIIIIENNNIQIEASGKRFWAKISPYEFENGKYKLTFKLNNKPTREINWGFYVINTKNGYNYIESIDYPVSFNNETNIGEITFEMKNRGEIKADDDIQIGVFNLNADFTGISNVQLIEI